MEAYPKNVLELYNNNSFDALNSEKKQNAKKELGKDCEEKFKKRLKKDCRKGFEEGMKKACADLTPALAAIGMDVAEIALLIGLTVREYLAKLMPAFKKEDVIQKIIASTQILPLPSAGKLTNKSALLCSYRP
ncbi:MAG: hypothetical protein LBG47_03630 [Prevotellaceae bacterium]|jgi:flagellar biosynthesis/type III secretory pathway protein FliH|nr:hypothetical protein [Prevotellaceae bacterium]